MKDRVVIGSFRDSGDKDFKHLGSLWLPRGEKPLRLALLANGAADGLRHWASCYSLDVQLHPQE